MNNTTCALTVLKHGQCQTKRERNQRKKQGMSMGNEKAQSFKEDLSPLLLNLLATDSSLD